MGTVFYTGWGRHCRTARTCCTTPTHELCSPHNAAPGGSAQCAGPSPEPQALAARQATAADNCSVSNPPTSTLRSDAPITHRHTPAFQDATRQARTYLLVRPLVRSLPMHTTLTHAYAQLNNNQQPPGAAFIQSVKHDGARRWQAQRAVAGLLQFC